MATDLTKVNDHPVTLLRKHAEEHHRRLNHPALAAAVESAAETLRAHEQEHGVTFAALDNEALSRVAEAYERVSTSGPGYKQDFAEVDLADAIRDLLGLGD